MQSSYCTIDKHDASIQKNFSCWVLFILNLKRRKILKLTKSQEFIHDDAWVTVGMKVLPRARLADTYKVIENVVNYCDENRDSNWLKFSRDYEPSRHQNTREVTLTDCILNGKHVWTFY